MQLPDQPTHLAESPFRIARRYSEADLKGTADHSELAWLYAHPVLWIRALVNIRGDVENHIAKDKRSIGDHKPTAGEDNRDWLRAKAAFEVRTRGRLHFLQKVKTRLEEVKSLVGAESVVDRMLVGDVIADLIDVAELATAGEYDSVRDKANFMASKLAERFGEPARYHSADPAATADTTIALGGQREPHLVLSIRPEADDENLDATCGPLVELHAEVQRDDVTIKFQAEMSEDEARQVVNAIQASMSVARRKAALRGHYDWLATQDGSPAREDPIR